MKADASHALDRPLEEVAAQCRHLELTGRDSSPELRQRVGLLKRIATGHDLLTDLQTAGDVVFAATPSGAALAIDVHTLRAERTELPASALRLTATTGVKRTSSATARRT